MTKLRLALVALAASAGLALPAVAAPLTTSHSAVRVAQATVKEKVVVKKPAKKKVIVKRPRKKTVVVGTPGVVVAAPTGCKMVSTKVRRNGKVVVKKVRRC